MSAMNKMVDKTALFEPAWFGEVASGVEDSEESETEADAEGLAEAIELGNEVPVEAVLEAVLGVAPEGESVLLALLQTAFSIPGQHGSSTILQSSVQTEGQASSRLLKDAVGHTVIAQTILGEWGIEAVGLMSSSAANTLATSAKNNKIGSEVFICKVKKKLKEKGFRNKRKNEKNN